MRQLTKPRRASLMKRIKARKLFLLMLMTILYFNVFADNVPYRLLQDDLLKFSGGIIDSQNEDIYIIEMGNYDINKEYPLVISRPKGAEANYPVSINYDFINGNIGWRLTASLIKNNPAPDYELMSGVLTFQPGETSKTIYISSLEEGAIDPPLKFKGFGTAYLFFTYADRTKTEQSVIQMNFTNPNSLEIPPILSQENTIQTVSFNGLHYSTLTLGQYVVLNANYRENSGIFEPYSNIKKEQQLTLSTYQIKHNELPVDVSDSEQEQRQIVSLTPRETGTTSNSVSFLFKLTEEAVVTNYYPDEESSALPINIDKLERIEQAETGEGIDKEVTITSVDQNMDITLYPNSAFLLPRFGTISTDKPSHYGGEAVIITVPFLNWKLYKKALAANWLDNIQLTIDNGSTYIADNRRFNEDNETLQFTFSAPMVTGSTDSTINAEIAIRNIPYIAQRDDRDVTRTVHLYGVNTTVTIKPEAARTIYTDSIQVSGLPDQGKIFFENQKKLQVNYTVFPINSSFLKAVWSIDSTEVAEVSETGAITIKKAGNFTLSLKSNEVAWREENNMSENNDVLIKTFNIIVKDSLPKLSGISSWCKIDSTATVNFYHNMKEHWIIKDNKVTLTAILADGREKTIEQSVNPDENMFSYTVLFEDDFPQLLSQKDENGNWQPSVHVVASLLIIDPIDGEEYRIKATSDIYTDLLPIQYSKIIMQRELYRKDKKIEITQEIFNLPKNDYKISYILNKSHNGLSNVVDEKTFDSTSGVGVPEWLTLTDNGNYYHAVVKFDFPVTGESKYLLTLTTDNKIHYIKEETSYVAEIYEAQAESVSATVSATYNNYVNLEEHPKDNNEIVNEILQGIKSGTLVNNEFMMAIKEKLIDNSLKTFRVLYQSEWGMPEISLEGGVLTEPISTTTSNVYFSVHFPLDGKPYTVRIKWPELNVEKSFTYTNYNINTDRLFTFNIQGYNDNNEKFQIEYMTGNGNKETKDIEIGNNFYIYEPDSIVSARILANKGNRIPTLLPSVRSGLDFGTNIYQPDLLVNSWTWNGGNLPKILNSEKLNERWGDVFVNLLDEEGSVVTNARLNYVVLDKDKKPTGQSGQISRADERGFAIPLISTLDTWDKSLLIEVVAEGYNPQLVHYHKLFRPSGNWEYSNRHYFVKAYESVWSYSGKADREYDVVLKKSKSIFSNISLLVQEGSTTRYSEDNIKYLGQYDLTKVSLNSTTSYTEMYADLCYYIHDDFLEWIDYCPGVKLNVSFSWDEEDNPANFLLTGKGSNKSPAPETYKYYSKNDYNGFEHSYVDLEYNLSGFLDGEKQTYPFIKSGNKVIGQLPGLQNIDINKDKLAEELDFDLPISPLEVNKVDDNAKKNGANMKDADKAFDKFDITLPSGLPFTFNVERSGNRFIIRGLVAINFFPGGKMADMAELAQDFSSLYFDCINAVNNNNAIEQSNSTKMNSVFTGVRGFISAVGVYNPETGKVDVTLHGGGISLEASANVVHKCSFGIGSFGVGLEGKIATGVSFMNATAANEDISGKIKIDVVLDTEVMLKLWAWAEGGIDLWIVSATAGIEGGGKISHTQRSVFRTYDGQKPNVGFKTQLGVYMKAYAQARFLFWSKRKEWKIFDYNKTFLTPNDGFNPFHKDYDGPQYSMSSTSLLSSTYQPVSLYSLRSATSPIINDVGDNATPRYLYGGESLLFSNIKDPLDNNDDRLQIYSSGSASDLVTTETPSFAFDVSSTADKTVVVYEQLAERLLESDLTDYPEEAAISMQASKTKIVASMKNGGAWVTDTLSKNQQANMNPRTFLQKEDGQAVAVWSSGEMITTENDDQYVNGELLISRYKNAKWSQPIRITGLDKNYVLSDYNLIMAKDTALIIASRRIETGENAKQDEIVFFSVAPNNDVRIFSSSFDGRNPQIKRIKDTNLVSFLTQTPDTTQDVYLMTVNMLGLPAGKINSFAGLGERTLQNVKLMTDEKATDLNGVAILWDEPVQINNPADTENFKIETALYAAKLGKQNDLLYASAPVKLLTVPEAHTAISYDAYLDGLDLKAAITIANNNLGAVIVEEKTTFTNSIECLSSYYPMTDLQENYDLPVSLTVQNNGYQPISSVDVTMNGRTETTAVWLMPGQTATVGGIYTIPENFNGDISYDIAAEFTVPTDYSLRSTAFRSSEKKTTSGNRNAMVTDLSLDIFSNTSDDTHTSLLAKVVNGSPFPLLPGYDVKVGLYKDPNGKETYPGTSVQTITTDKLYNSTEKENLGTVIAFKVKNVLRMETAYAIVKTEKNGTPVTDKNISDNLVPVQLFPKAIAIVIPTITTASLPDGTVNIPYSYQLTAEGALAITWKIEDGYLPVGLALDATTGIISGTPTKAGTSGFKVVAENATATDTITFSIKIDPAIVPVNYTLTIPQVEGIATYPVAGDHSIVENEPVSIDVYANIGYSIADMVLKVNGSVMQPYHTALEEYNYSLGKMNKNMVVSIDGVKVSDGPVDNTVVEKDELYVTSVNGGLSIHGLKAGEELIVYNIIGQPVYQGKAVIDPQFVSLNARGLYVIATKDRRVKAKY